MSEFKCLFGLKVDSKFFNEIGYFGKGTWDDAVEFSKNNSEGWRLPTREEMSYDILTKHNEIIFEAVVNKLHNSRHKDYFSVWTDEEYNENAAYSGTITEGCNWDTLGFEYVGTDIDCKKSPLHMVLVR